MVVKIILCFIELCSQFSPAASPTPSGITTEPSSTGMTPPPLLLQVKNEERNRRNDLYVLANSYSGRLKGAKPNLMPETDFHIVPKRPQAAKVVNGASEKSSSTAANDVKSSGEVVEQNEKIVKVGLSIHICHVSLVLSFLSLSNTNTHAITKITYTYTHTCIIFTTRMSHISRASMTAYNPPTDGDFRDYQWRAGGQGRQGGEGDQERVSKVSQGLFPLPLCFNFTIFPKFAYFFFICFSEI